MKIVKQITHKRHLVSKFIDNFGNNLVIYDKESLRAIKGCLPTSSLKVTQRVKLNICFPSLNRSYGENAVPRKSYIYI